MASGLSPFGDAEWAFFLCKRLWCVQLLRVCDNTHRMAGSIIQLAPNPHLSPRNRREKQGPDGSDRHGWPPLLA